MSPRGNPLRWQGALIALGAFGALVLLMAKPSVWRLGVPIGAALTLVAIHGIADALGTFDDRDSTRVARVVRLADLGRGAMPLVTALFLGFAFVTLAVDGWLPPWVTAIGVTGAAWGSIVAMGRLLERIGVLTDDDDGAERPLHRRHGAWLLAIGAGLYLPTLGSHSLLDPWETHYGEVAREILARDDWISLWWAQDGWFWSKPVLGFWLQALGMATFGVRTGAGEMLSAASEGRTPWPEWAVRLPFATFAILAAYVLYKAIARSHGRRAGFLAALVLTTMPQWFLVSHQTMTDMPFVAAITASFAFFLLGLHADPSAEARLFEIHLPGGLRPLRVGAHHLVLGALLATVLPQLALLLAQNVWFGDRWPPIKLVKDTFSAGSPGNCGLPGNDACRAFSATFPKLAPGLQAILWIQPLALLLAMAWGERRTRRLSFLAAWWCAAIATMAKGVAGAALPILCLVLLIVLLRRWRDVLDLEVPAGLLIAIATVMPWMVAMVARHGVPFLDRLLFHDMVKRALGHVHDTNQGDDVSFRYYLWQLGYATFPWVGVALAAVVRALQAGPPRGDPTASEARRATEVLLLSWAAVTFALFSLMETKFHHYILPALPPLAGWIGITLAEAWEAEASGASKGEGDGDGGLLRARALVLAAGAVPLVAFVGRDLVGASGAGLARLMHLFTYNYGRAWPEGLGGRGALAAFVAVATFATALVFVPRMWRRGTMLLAATSMAFAAWGLDVYLVRASPHWGQRELVLRWQAERSADPGPLAAYQLNWKGENFYTGNQLPAFVSSGRPFREWLAKERRKGQRTFYFVSLHDRADTLAAEVGLPARWRDPDAASPVGAFALTTPADNARFVLVRVRFPKGTVVPREPEEG